MSPAWPRCHRPTRHGVARVAVREGPVRDAGRQAVLDEVERTAADGQAVGPVAVPVTDEDDVARVAVGEGRVRDTGRQRVPHEVLVAAAHGEGVAAVAVPVADEHGVARVAVGEGVVGLAAVLLSRT